MYVRLLLTDILGRGGSNFPWQVRTFLEDLGLDLVHSGRRRSRKALVCRDMPSGRGGPDHRRVIPGA